MKDKYYVRDIMEMFHIGRNTIKYYEDQGIIKGEREPNGYRRYSYLDVKRIERVLSLRYCGFTIEQIQRFLTGLSVEEEFRLNEERIQMVESQIKNLQQELEFLKWMDDSKRKIPEYYKQYQLCDDFKVCLGCSNSNLQETEWKMQRELKILYFDEYFHLIREEEYENTVTQQTFWTNEICKHCSSNQIVQGKFVHGIIKMKDMDQIEELMKKIDADLNAQGYRIERRVYCLYEYYIEAEPLEEGIGVGYYIPVTMKGI